MMVMSLSKIGKQHTGSNTEFLIFLKFQNYVLYIHIFFSLVMKQFWLYIILQLSKSSFTLKNDTQKCFCVLGVQRYREKLDHL